MLTDAKLKEYGTALGKVLFEISANIVAQAKGQLAAEGKEHGPSFVAVNFSPMFVAVFEEAIRVKASAQHGITASIVCTEVAKILHDSLQGQLQQEDTLSAWHIPELNSKPPKPNQ